MPGKQSGAALGVSCRRVPWACSSSYTSPVVSTLSVSGLG